MNCTGNRQLRLSSHGLGDTVRFYSERISLAEGQRESWETLTRVVKFDDPFYGEVEITREKMAQMIRNFEADVYGQIINVDVAHNASDGAAGYIRELQIQGDILRQRIEWTDFGIDAVTRRGFRYFSPEYHENYKNPETGEKHGPTLLGAALTTRPRVKRLDPINPDRLRLSYDDDGNHPPALSPTIQTLLLEEISAMKDKLLNQFNQFLAGLKHFSEDLIKQFGSQFEATLESMTDEAQGEILLAAFQNSAESVHVALQDHSNQGDIKLDFSGLKEVLGGVGAGMSEADIRRIMLDEEKKRQQAVDELAARREANVKLFSDAIEAQKGFSDALKKELSEGTHDLITAEMSSDQIKALADNQIALGNKIAAQARLAGMGFQSPAGSVHIQMQDGNAIKALQEEVDKRLGIADMPAHKRFGTTGGELQPENKAFAEKVLAEFDRDRAAQLHHEHKLLAAGDGIVSDVAVPSIFERTVIREALYGLVGLNFVNVGTLPFASSALIPYSYRDTTAAGRNSTRVYEGGSIPRAGVKQASDTAYPIPQKIAFEVSDELRYLTGAGILNWDAVTENQANASRIIREDTEQLIFNEVLNASDEYAITAVTNENLELQADGAKTIFILAQFPVVRPRKVYDLQGNQVGSTVNPITVTYNSVVRAEYDGTGTQSAGIYYVLDYNLGEIYLVNETGVVQIPADTVAYTISYSYTTNVYKFDTDLGSTDADVHWDGFLYRYGLRKAVIEDDRYYMANFGLMSGTLMTQVERAKQFGANSRRPGTDLMADGNLGRIKDVPNFKTSAPGLNMGDVRAIVGERSQTRMRMMKSWMMGELENQKDSNGRFTGKKEAYGDQFMVLHTPTQLKAAYTSILAYSATARVAR